MNQYDCLQLLRQIKDVSFATVDHLGRPRNRIIDVMGIQDGRLIFFVPQEGHRFLSGIVGTSLCRSCRL